MEVRLFHLSTAFSFKQTLITYLVFGAHWPFQPSTACQRPVKSKAEHLIFERGSNLKILGLYLHSKLKHQVTIHNSITSTSLHGSTGHPSYPPTVGVIGAHPEPLYHSAQGPHRVDNELLMAHIYSQIWPIRLNQTGVLIKPPLSQPMTD